MFSGKTIKKLFSRNWKTLGRVSSMSLIRCPPKIHKYSKTSVLILVETPPPLVGNLALNKGGGVFEGFGDLARFGSKFFARLRRAFPLCIPIFARRRREKIPFSRHFPLENSVFRVFFRARLRRAFVFEIPLLHSTND